LAEPCEPLNQEQAARVVPPVTVEQVAGEEQHPGLLLEAQLDQLFECPAGRVPDAFDRRTGVPLQAAKRAVEMKIGRVNQLEPQESPTGTACARFEQCRSGRAPRSPVQSGRNGLLDGGTPLHGPSAPFVVSPGLPSSSLRLSFIK